MGAAMSSQAVNIRLLELEASAADYRERIAVLESAILDPIEAKIMEVVMNRLGDGTAIAMYQGFGPQQGWNAYVPLADEVMTKEMAVELAEKYNGSG